MVQLNYATMLCRQFRGAAAPLTRAEGGYITGKGAAGEGEGGEGVGGGVLS